MLLHRPKTTRRLLPSKTPLKPAESSIPPSHGQNTPSTRSHISTFARNVKQSAVPDVFRKKSSRHSVQCVYSKFRSLRSKQMGIGTSPRSQLIRCVRNCFQCPTCLAGLNIFPNEETQSAPYTLNCTYCQWSSTDIGVEFEKPTGISGTHCNNIDSRTIAKAGISCKWSTSRI
jgi:hypothetical protein